MIFAMKERMVLQWHITHRCNLRCTHCYQEDYKNHMSKEDLFYVLDKFTDFIQRYHYYGQINLTGGEPLLHPDFFELAEEIKRRGFRLGILTNGTLITKEYAGRIADLNPVFVQVSLEGTKKINDSIRGEGAFDRTIKAIDYLKRKKIRVLVSFTAQKNNYRELEKLARICKRHHVDKLWWDRVVTETDEEKYALALSTEEFQWLVDKTGSLIKKYQRRDGSSMVTNQRALQFLGCGTENAGYHCSAGKNLVAVLADGTVMPCRRLPFSLGNILETDFETLLSSKEMMLELRKFMYPKECEGCTYLSKCRGGARCVTYGQTGNVYAKDVNCFYTSVHTDKNILKKHVEKMY